MLRKRTNNIEKTKGWNADRTRQAFELALLGATDEEIARVFGVDINTISLWKRTHPEFLQSLQDGKLAADAKVVASLYKRATGFWMTEMHVCMYRGEVIQTPVDKYYPPDSWAAAKWAAIRQRPRWSEVAKTESVHTNINLTSINFDGLSLEDLRSIKQIGTRLVQTALPVHDINEN